MINYFKIKAKYLKNRFNENTCLMLIWLVNFNPRIGGFPLQTDKISALFMFMNISLLFYAFIVGSVAYLINVADGFFESIVTLFNIQMFAAVLNNTLWFIFKKKDLTQLITQVLKNDSLLLNSNRFVDDYKKLLGRIKNIIITCYLFHTTNDILLYMPTRMYHRDKFSIVSCYGFNLDSDSSLAVCALLFSSQMLTSLVVIVAFDCLVLFMFSHTTAIFHILYKDMESFKEISENINASNDMIEIAAKRIMNIAVRHSAVLDTVDKMQRIYTVALGCSFIQNAISLCLFFVLPIEISMNFGPFITYTLFVYFLYCYYGQRLTKASEKFEMAVYSCGWEKLPVKQQKTILVILRQSQKPVVLKAADIVPISIYTFACAMQNIYKLVTVFKL